MVRLKVVSVTYALCGMMDVMVGALRGIGYSIMPMIVSMIGACGLRLVWLATIFSNTKVSYSPHDLCIVSDHLGDHVFCTYLLFYLGKTMCGEKSGSLKIDNKIG